MILKAKTRGSPVQTGRDSAKKARKNLSCWDKEGGVDGLSVWIVYDFLTAKQKSVPWLSQWIHNLQGQQIMTIVEEAGRGQAHKMDDDEDDVEVSQDLNERLSGSDQSQRGHKVKFDVVDIDEYLLSTTQNKKQKRLVQHHQQPEVKDLLENYPHAALNSQYYLKCANKKKKGHLDDSKCQSNQFCTYQKMVAMGDTIAALPQPLPGGAQGALQSNLTNESFANREFPNRNIIVQSLNSNDRIQQLNERYAVPGAARENVLKKENSRWVATELQLDKWHAQSLGISHQDYVEKKKHYQRLSRGANPDKQNIQAPQKMTKKNTFMVQNVNGSKIGARDQLDKQPIVLIQDENSASMKEDGGNVDKLLQDRQQLGNSTRSLNKKRALKNWTSQTHKSKTQSQLNREKVLSDRKEQIRSLISKQNQSQSTSNQFKSSRVINQRAKSSTIDSLDRSPDPSGIFGTITETVSFQQLLRQVQDRSESKMIQPGDHLNMKAITYSKYELPQSQVIQIARDKQSQIDQYRNQQKMHGRVSEYRNMKQQQQAGERQVSSVRQVSSFERLKSGSKMMSLQRNQMLEELGGFYSNKIKELYYQQISRPQSTDKHQRCNSNLDNHRRLICMTDMQHYNKQKEEIEKLLAENKQKNKEAEARRQHELHAKVRQNRQSALSKHQAKMDEFFVLKKLENQQMNQFGTTRAQSSYQIKMKKTSNQDRICADPYDMQYQVQPKFKVQKELSSVRQTSSFKSRNRYVQPRTAAATEPELQKELNPEVYNSVQNLRKQNSFLKQKSMILLQSYSKQNRSASALQQKQEQLQTVEKDSNSQKQQSTYKEDSKLNVSKSQNYFNNFNQYFASAISNNRQQNNWSANLDAQKSLLIKHILDRQPVDKDANSHESSRFNGSSCDDQTSQQNKENGIVSYEGKLRSKNDATKRMIIQREIRHDNTLDIEGTKTEPEQDVRMIKISLKSIDFEPDETLRNKKFDFNDANFWFIKGYNHCHGSVNEEESAIDSYRQAIGIDPFHVESIHNLACVYENQQRFQLAIKWFSIALELKSMDQDLKDAYYGVALSYFKSGNAGNAVQPLDMAIKILDDEMEQDRQACSRKKENFKKKKWFDYYYFRYLRALCHRVLGNHQESERDYSDIVEAFKEQEGRQICRNIFSMVIIPFEDNRRRILRLVDQFQHILDKYEVERDRIILHHHFLEGQEPRWKENRRKHVHMVLMHLSFFKKFSPNRIREMMDKMTVKVVRAGSILFFEPNKVYVIVGGSILMQNHWQRTDLPVTHAKFINGAILNFMQDQSEIFNSLETWFVAQVTTEVAVFDKDYFREVWNSDIMTEEFMFMRAYLKCYEVFKNFSDLALMIVVSELMQVKTFQKEKLILPQSAVAPSSDMHQEYIRKHKVIQNDKSKAQKNCGLQQLHNHSKRRGLKKDGKANTKVSIMKSAKEPLEPSLEATSSRCPSDEDQTGGNGNSTTAKRNEVDCYDLHAQDTLLKETRDWMGDVKKVEESEKPSLVQNKGLAGLYVIIKGRCKVVHNKDNYTATYLQGGECFGESDLLKIVGFDYFGDIIADSDEVQCLYISQQNFQKIPLFEQNNIRDYAKERRAIRYLAYEYCKKYQIDFQDYANPKN